MKQCPIGRLVLHIHAKIRSSWHTCPGVKIPVLAKCKLSSGSSTVWWTPSVQRAKPTVFSTTVLQCRVTWKRLLWRGRINPQDGYKQFSVGRNEGQWQWAGLQRHGRLGGATFKRP